MAVLLLTAATLIAFAANSLLCRMALGGDLVDPVSFTTLRLASGALALAALSRILSKSRPPRSARGSWGSSLALVAYAASFSLAYVSLGTGMGALILFGAVQVTMIGAGLRSGERLGPMQWIGSALAAGGLLYLVLPGLSAPDPLGALLMGIAGIAWGVYSIRGKGSPAPLVMTAGNFLRSTPMILLASALALPWAPARAKPLGILLAVVSGALTSGMGYVLWYRALRTLTTTQASVVQLLVPVLAGFGGVVLLSEQVTVRLIAASVLILGGVAMAARRRASS